jgi:hypothetical protein
MQLQFISVDCCILWDTRVGCTTFLKGPFVATHVMIKKTTTGERCLRKREYPLSISAGGRLVRRSPALSQNYGGEGQLGLKQEKVCNTGIERD